MLVELDLGGAFTLGQFSWRGPLSVGLLGVVLTLQVGGLTLPGLSLYEKLFFLFPVTWMTHGDGVLDSGDERRGTCFPCTLPLRVRLFSRGVTAPMTLSWWGSASMELVGFITLITVPAGIPSANRCHGFLSLCFFVFFS